MAIEQLLWFLAR